MAEIEYLLLADHAEAVSGKLNVLGAGWTVWNRPPRAEGDVPATSHFGVGISILIPWAETNQRHRLVIKVETEDGDPELLGLDTDLEMGRPPGVPAGIDQRAVLAFNADVVFPGPGGYRVVARLGDATKTASFRVNDLA